MTGTAKGVAKKRLLRSVPASELLPVMPEFRLRSIRSSVPAVKPSTVRVRQMRDRKRNGISIIPIPVGVEHIGGLIDGGYLSADKANDRAAIVNALLIALPLAKEAAAKEAVKPGKRAAL